jgi:hypothetical protein
MFQLRKLVIIKRGVTLYLDTMVQALFFWINQHMGHMNRLWIEEDTAFYSLDFSLSDAPILSLMIETNARFELTEERFKNLQHFSGKICFSEIDYLPSLKYVRGYCSNDYVSVNLNTIF